MYGLRILQTVPRGASIAALAMVAAGASGQLPSVPVGAIVAYSGRLAEMPPSFQLCDGRLYTQEQYPVLWTVIGTQWGKGDVAHPTAGRLPNLTGRFLRGVDAAHAVDPDADARVASLPGGNTGARVGTLEGYATALPRAGFVTGIEDTPHTHVVVVNGSNEGGPNFYDSGPGRGVADPTTVTVSDNTQGHTHQVIGGDKETTPINVAVHWVIRVK